MTRRTRVDQHTRWCARDHRCNLAEHRSAEILVDLPGHARAVLVRVRASDGREHAEIRVRVALVDVEPAARRQLGTLLADLRDLVIRAAAIRRPQPGRTAA
ncbi:hypothetical protein [Micromonospora sp. NBRC 101691]|uniref:hypothetical protein n=1 Tax=Micromonospora sp. NBRC 101691 TaxID=3032198 RepID=UPI0024A09EE7|nr:hypothetical protein [Micromonospora sp. NBRC 101691]GLY24834.1 hypothetical protein Misp04_45660 [Micromonospora sp. NBRC 101691]